MKELYLVGIYYEKKDYWEYNVCFENDGKFYVYDETYVEYDDEKDWYQVVAPKMRVKKIDDIWWS